VHLVQPLYKHIMGWPVSLRDLEQVDDQIFRNLMQMLDMDDVSMLGLDFSISEDQLGVAATIELVENGSSIDVDNSNCASYLDAQLRYRLMDKNPTSTWRNLEGFL